MSRHGQRESNRKKERTKIAVAHTHHLKSDKSQMWLAGVSFSEPKHCSMLKGLIFAQLMGNRLSYIRSRNGLKNPNTALCSSPVRKSAMQQSFPTARTRQTAVVGDNHNNVLTSALHSVCVYVCVGWPLCKERMLHHGNLCRYSQLIMQRPADRYECEDAPWN